MRILAAAFLACIAGVWTDIWRWCRDLFPDSGILRGWLLHRSIGRGRIFIDVNRVSTWLNVQNMPIIDGIVSKPDTIASKPQAITIPANIGS